MEPFFSDNKEKEEENQFIHAMELIGGSVLPVVLKALIELQVLDILAEAGPGAQLSPSEILSRLSPSATLGSNPNAPELLDRMLCFLVSHSILTCSVISSNQASPPAALVRPRRLYGLAPVAKYLVNNQDGCSLAPLLFFSQDKVFMDGWDGLKGAILEGGIPFARVHGMQLFEYPGKDPRFNEVFNKAMLNVTTIIVKRILNSYKGFEQLQNLVDVAGGLGVTLHLITSKYPHIRAINFDLPHVIKHAPPYPGVEHVGGDMFESVPKGDAIFLKYILHDWSDDQCLKLLKNCHKALPANGKVIVAEGILPVIPDRSDATKYICRMDVFIMAGLGGKERTQQEFMALAIGAGFSGIKFECYACNLWVMEFYK